MTSELSGGLLYVVTDKAGNLVVALDEPVIAGQAQRAASGGIVELDLVPVVLAVNQYGGEETRESTVSADPPGIRDERTLAYLGAGLAVIVGLLLWILLTPWLGVPVGVGIGAFVVMRFLNQESLLVERWRGRHRVFDHYDDKSVFSQAFTAAKTIIHSWPHIRPLVQAAIPERELAASLWSLSGLLSDRGKLRTQQQSLRRAQVDLPPGTAVGQEVADRLARVDGSIAEVDVEIKRRVSALEEFAQECIEFIRAEQAIARAREAVRQADLSLGELIPPSATPRDTSEDLAERTRAIMDAYRQLSGMSPPGHP